MPPAEAPKQILHSPRRLNRQDRVKSYHHSSLSCRPARPFPVSRGLTPPASPERRPGIFLHVAVDIRRRWVAAFGGRAAPPRFVVAGGGPLLPSLRALAAALGLSVAAGTGPHADADAGAGADVVFLGTVPLDGVADVLASLDVFVNPCTVETFGVANAEARVLNCLSQVMPPAKYGDASVWG